VAARYFVKKFTRDNRGVFEMTTYEKFSGKNYDIERTAEGQFVLVHPVGPDETYESFSELVADHPVCSEAAAWAERAENDRR
jgi:hypothetical protein